MCLRGDALLFAAVFEKFRTMCLKIYQLDPVKFPSSPGLEEQTAQRKSEEKLKLLIDIDLLICY